MVNSKTEDKIKQKGDIVYHVSAGGYLFYKDNNDIYVALVKKPEGYYIPKGHVKYDEKPVDAAVREINEELGLSINPKLIGRLGTMNYEFTLPDDTKLHKKIVHLFVFETDKKLKLTHEKDNFEGANWFEVNEAKTKLLYDHAFFEKAVRLFNKTKKLLS